MNVDLTPEEAGLIVIALSKLPEAEWSEKEVAQVLGVAQKDTVFGLTKEGLEMLENARNKIMPKLLPLAEEYIKGEKFPPWLLKKEGV